MSRRVEVSKAALQCAVAILRTGGVVAFPTETYYGLAVDPLNQSAVERLYRIKQRSRRLPILVLVAGSQQLSAVVSHVPARYLALIAKFWPGPLTLVCPARAELSACLTGGTGTIGVRHSSNPVANQLLAAFGGPLTATSANLSGSPPAVIARQVEEAFADQVDLVLDGGATPGGCGSTVVGLDEESGLRCLREGKIVFSLVQQVCAAHNEKISCSFAGASGGAD